MGGKRGLWSYPLSEPGRRFPPAPKLASSSPPRSIWHARPALSYWLPGGRRFGHRGLSAAQAWQVPKEAGPPPRLTWQMQILPRSFWAHGFARHLLLLLRGLLGVQLLSPACHGAKDSPFADVLSPRRPPAHDVPGWEEVCCRGSLGPTEPQASQAGRGAWWLPPQ